MKTQKKDNWEYTGEYGEKWIFEYDSLTGVGNLKGSDISWQSYKVIDGKANGLFVK